MNVKVYNAVITQLRADAMRQLAELEYLMMAPADEHTIDNAIEKALLLVQSEGAIHTVQQYFRPRPVAPPPAPLPSPEAATKVAAEPPKKITEEMSPSYRKSIEAEKKRQKAEAERIKKEAKNSKTPKGKK